MTNPSARPPVDVIYDQDFIVVYDALDAALCRDIVALFDQDGGKSRGKIGGKDTGAPSGAAERFYKDDAKVSWDLEVQGAGVWRDVFQRMHGPIQACLAEYLARSPILQSFDLQASGYKIQMYPKNEGRFRWHADSVGPHGADRVVAMVLYLNDVDRGGETEFFHQGIKVIPKAGQLVLFPAGWTHMHCGHVPESGDKYVISTFIKVKR